MQYIRASSAGMAGSTLTPVPEQFHLWLAIGMMYGQIGQPRSRVLQC